MRLPNETEWVYAIDYGEGATDVREFFDAAATSFFESAKAIIDGMNPIRCIRFKEDDDEQRECRWYKLSFSQLTQVYEDRIRVYVDYANYPDMPLEDGHVDQLTAIFDSLAPLLGRKQTSYDADDGIEVYRKVTENGTVYSN